MRFSSSTARAANRCSSSSPARPRDGAHRNDAIQQFKRPDIKPLAERNRLAVGVVGILAVVAVVVAAFSYDKIPFIKGTSDYSAYFAEAGGIKPGSDVRVSGLSRRQGLRRSTWRGRKVRVDFTVDNGVELGDRTEAAIKTETVLGTKMLEVTPRGDGRARPAPSRSSGPRRPTTCRPRWAT